jgi:CheY-like chemotaxis protein
MLIDENRVRQILLNLVGNAIKFTPEGFVSLTLEITGSDAGYGDLYFRVKDSGIGIPKKDQKRIFSPFEQQNPEHKISFGGTGLGLAICERLVQAMGGRIDLISEPFEGSEFTVFIPHVQWLQETLHLGEKGYRSHTLVQFEPAVVMIIDDVESNRTVLSDMMIQIGLTPLPVASAWKGLEMLKTVTPDIILTDLRMPEMNGQEFLKEVRTTYRHPGTPVVAVTAQTALLNDSRSQFDASLLKPVQIKDLIDVLIHYLRVQPEYMTSAGESTHPDSIHKLAGSPARLIRDQVLPRMLSVSQIFSVQRARKIAEDIDGIARNEESELLLGIASDLREAADNYDLRRVKEIIKILEKISS